MELSARIKQARLEAGMSQRQLSDGIVTRNMLSLIESGKARPGMDTLMAFAARLGKNIAYFLEQEAVLSPNQNIMADARSFYASGNAEAARERLAAYRQPDDVFDQERALLEAQCLMAMAETAITRNQPVYARELLEKAGAEGKLSHYYTDALERQRLYLLFRADPTQAEAIWAQMPKGLDEELLLAATAMYRTTQYTRCTALLDAATNRTAQWYLLRGMTAVHEKQYDDGIRWLQKAEPDFPRETAPLLEECFRETGDFKSAYTYALKQRNAFSK